MNLISRRFEYGETYTISRLYVDNIYECYVLEDKVRDPGVKVPGETAIMAGKYRVIIDYSTRFGKDLPHILAVPMFEGVRIHSGNTSEDTEGCLLVGTVWNGGDHISNSRLAFANLYEKLIKSKDPINIEIIDTK